MYYIKQLHDFLCNWGKLEGAPPRAPQRLQSLSHNNNDNDNNNILYILPNAHARNLRGEQFKSSKVSRGRVCRLGQRRGQAESHGKRERYQCASELAQHREMHLVR